MTRNENGKTRKNPKTPDAYWRRGEPWIWTAGAALALVLAAMLGFAGLVLTGAGPVFWPAPLVEATTVEGERFLGALLSDEVDPDGGRRRQFKVANRDLNGGADFRWFSAEAIKEETFPADAVRVERLHGGDFHGRLRALVNTETPFADTPTPEEFARALSAVRQRIATSEPRWRGNSPPNRTGCARCVWPC